MIPFSSLFEYMSNSASAKIPEETLHLAKRGILDTVAVMIAGSQYAPLPDITKIPKQGGGDSTIVGLKAGYAPQTAALYNGISAHVLDMDDHGLRMGHPSAVLIPSLFALGEHLDSSGEEILRAYINSLTAGYYFGKYCYRYIHAAGWHATSVVMSPIASLACGSLLNFDFEKYHQAFGVAVSMSCGLRGNFGTPTKPLHVGVTSQNAVNTSMLVNSGMMTASDSAITGKEGFLQLYSGIEYDDKIFTELASSLYKESPLINPGLIIKSFPSCSSNHQATFALYDILSEHPEITPDQVVSIEMGANTSTLKELVTPNPKTGVEARFSPGFHFALALNDETIDPSKFTTDTIKRPEIARIIKLTKLIHVPEYDSIPGITVWPAHVKLTLKSGKTYHKLRIFADGSKELPLSDKKLKEKYYTCTEPVIGSEQSKKLYHLLASLETVPSIKQATSLYKGEI